jgi:hypothetical protein
MSRDYYEEERQEVYQAVALTLESVELSGHRLAACGRLLAALFQPANRIGPGLLAKSELGDPGGQLGADIVGGGPLRVLPRFRPRGPALAASVEGEAYLAAIARAVKGRIDDKADDRGNEGDGNRDGGFHVVGRPS